MCYVETQHYNRALILIWIFSGWFLFERCRERPYCCIKSHQCVVFRPMLILSYVLSYVMCYISCSIFGFFSFITLVFLFVYCLLFISLLLPYVMVNKDYQQRIPAALLTPPTSNATDQVVSLPATSRTPFHPTAWSWALISASALPPPSMTARQRVGL